PGVVRLQGVLDRETLQAAFHQLLARHEALRTTFAVNSAGTPIQEVHDEVPLEIPITVVTEAEVPGMLKEIITRPFDLSTPPLIRVHLLQVAEDDCLLVIVM